MTSPINEKRISWLVDHADYWYDDDESVDPEFEMNELKDRMREAGLYNPLTRNSSINVRHLLKKARKRFDSESELF